MENTMIENNVVTLEGRIISDFIFSHEVFGEGFYLFDLEVARLSGQLDVIPVMISDRIIDVNQNYVGMLISVRGQFRSYNKHEDSKNRLVLSVFSREFEFLDGDIQETDKNEIFIDGYVCKEPVYRKTPLGREIADLLLAVNRPYGKSDYIPCIVWGRNAVFCTSLSVGERLKVSGRIQSRSYIKKVNEEEITRVAYEVSVSKLSKE